MKITQLSVLAFLCCIACDTIREAPNGLKMKVHRQGIGEYAKPGEFLVTSMVIKDAKDSIWRDTRNQNLPMFVPVGLATEVDTEKGVESAFRVMKKGDSVEVPVDAKILFDGQPMPAGLKDGDKLIFIFSVSEITDQRGVNELYQQLQAKEYEKSMAQSEGQIGIDTVAIDAYLASKKIKALRDKSGLRYVITRLGKGAKPLLSSTVRVQYKGMLMENGEIFDQSSGPVEWPLTSLITGWQIGFQLLPKGSMATFYIPSKLGYGVTGYQPGIPPDANLIFEVELIDFK
ncbi:MAG: FKBP-type peptidyl-prolyl cis-trans isomerase [Cytophagales bacterium]|nr:FKBP-type peptidyl-prolyl cis-trans isomerase [Cytophagales bacterium]